MYPPRVHERVHRGATLGLLTFELTDRRRLFSLADRKTARSLASRIAIALAGTVERQGTLAGLSDDDLFQRLLHQRSGRQV